jgi:hypothetical protein
LIAGWRTVTATEAPGAGAALTPGLPYFVGSPLVQPPAHTA